jgi:hypothetical protein
MGRCCLIQTHPDPVPPPFNCVEVWRIDRRVQHKETSFLNCSKRALIPQAWLMILVQMHNLVILETDFPPGLELSVDQIHITIDRHVHSACFSPASLHRFALCLGFRLCLCLGLRLSLWPTISWQDKILKAPISEEAPDFDRKTLCLCIRSPCVRTKTSQNIAPYNGLTSFAKGAHGLT